jgi:hypothetical protein
MFVEEPINCQEHDVMAEIARGTFLPIATGERVFTKWGFREVLEKRAAPREARRVPVSERGSQPFRVGKVPYESRGTCVWKKGGLRLNPATDSPRRKQSSGLRGEYSPRPTRNNPNTFR